LGRWRKNLIGIDLPSRKQVKKCTHYIRQYLTFDLWEWLLSMTSPQMNFEVMIGVPNLVSRLPGNFQVTTLKKITMVIEARLRGDHNQSSFKAETHARRHLKCSILLPDLKQNTNVTTNLTNNSQHHIS
jgi:hypothetical protein